ncbi:MAG: hypothetical protein Q8K32_30580 [Archangium sp.]|nr:hypothetical protein [Archangium sp.]
MRTPVVLLLCLVAALSLTACRKKSSPEFFKLESQQSILVSRDGDEAWSSPEMDAVLNGLQAIPEDAMEKPRAQALAARIVAEQTRLKAEQNRPPPPAPVNPFADRVPMAERPAPVPDPETPEALEGVDAGEGPDQPWPGMAESLFVTRFGSCFAPGPKAVLPDARPASAYVLAASPACQKQFGPGKISFLFTDKGLWGKATETLEIRDAGIIVLPAPPAPPPPPLPTIITVPGAPLPEGY